MGVINVTPDSFYEKSRSYNTLSAIKRGVLLEAEGADILDIGGASSRPGSEPVSAQEELQRVLPTVIGLREQTKIPLSIDTYRPLVAEKALEAGAHYINDISGFFDPAMCTLAAQAHCPIILMHMQGTPKTMQDSPFYPQGVIFHLLAFFQERVETLLQAGVKEDKIILDPGIGFGKTAENNIEILNNIPQLQALGFPLLIGISRKSFMAKLLNKRAEELLAATLALNCKLILSKVDIIRVHDVKEHRDAIDLLQRFIPKQEASCGSSPSLKLPL